MEERKRTKRKRGGGRKRKTRVGREAEKLEGMG